MSTRGTVQREDEWQHKSHRGAYVRYESHHARQAAPEHGKRHPNQPEPEPDDQAEGGVHKCERREITGDALGDFGLGARCQADLFMTEQAYDPIAKFFAAHEDKQHQDKHEAGHAKELKIRPHHAPEPLLERWLGNHDHFLNWLGRLLTLYRSGRFEFCRHLVGELGETARGRLLARLNHPLELFLNLFLVVRQSIRERRQLLADNVTDAAKRNQRDDDRENHGRSTRNRPPLEKAHCSASASSRAPKAPAV